MKCQRLFSGKISKKKYFKISPAEILPRVLGVDTFMYKRLMEIIKTMEVGCIPLHAHIFTIFF